jgi:hypothetical protein
MFQVRIALAIAPFDSLVRLCGFYLSYGRMPGMTVGGRHRKPITQSRHRCNGLCTERFGMVREDCSVGCGVPACGTSQSTG